MRAGAEDRVHILIFGGAGFVGLNIAAACLEAGHRVTLLDRSPPPPAFGTGAAFVQGDVRDATAVDAAVADVDIAILGAAVTAGAAREAADPGGILAVNLMALPPILEACRRRGVSRVINLSSAAAYGAAPAVDGLLRETTPAEPESLYAVTKFASERVGHRLAAHWHLDLVSVRLSAVFGRWERDTGVRDTLSPQAQILAAAAAGRAALLPRPGERDWIYAGDVAEAVLAIATAKSKLAPLYNVGSGRRWSALAWGQAFARHVPGFACRLAGPQEAPNVDLHSNVDRPSLAADLLQRDVGWSARFDLETSAHDLAGWWRQHGKDA
ncbi:MAG: NAD(P)-dependent oxidoreductase [Hyphomicrobiaceae bacterium]|nr:NAD(P)-dependent oxidoreductase [Hyphomicrobiaceae bacterium]